ncbi:MAG: glycosyltransferase family 8 protein [Elusimicrobiota bacterium]|jgi:lipopolysaccharide biosynthesis glycosyltransferase|nr:glycosyltransferase family 8 protein [Elusimicrobiota bacterium]
MINIVSALDNNFVRHCAAAMASILDNHKILSEDDKIHFFILGNLTNMNKEALLSLRRIQDFDCSFIEIDEAQFKKIPLDGHSVTLCYRLLIPEILQDFASKVIHLDCDLILNADIKNLWDINIDDYLIAAVKDEPHINKAEGYFNAGVTIFNIKKLKEFDFKNKWRAYVDNLSENLKLKYYDQDILNDILRGNVFFLPPNWNVEKYNLGKFFSNYKGIENELYIIHYTTQAKPWLPLSDHPFKNLYIKYAKMTPWKYEVGIYKLKTMLKYASRIFFKYWVKHPVFFVKPKFWFRVRKEGFLKVII